MKTKQHTNGQLLDFLIPNCRITKQNKTQIKTKQHTKRFEFPNYWICDFLISELLNLWFLIYELFVFNFFRAFKESTHLCQGGAGQCMCCVLCVVVLFVLCCCCCVCFPAAHSKTRSTEAQSLRSEQDVSCWTPVNLRDPRHTRTTRIGPRVCFFT